MLQPVLVVMDVSDGTNRTTLTEGLKAVLERNGYRIRHVVPVAYTLDVPKGAITV